MTLLVAFALSVSVGTTFGGRGFRVVQPTLEAPGGREGAEDAQVTRLKAHACLLAPVLPEGLLSCPSLWEPLLLAPGLLPLRVGGSLTRPAPPSAQPFPPARPLGLGMGPLLCLSALAPVLAFHASHTQRLLDVTSQASLGQRGSCLPPAPGPQVSGKSTACCSSCPLPRPHARLSGQHPSGSHLSSLGTSTWVNVMSVVIALGPPRDKAHKSPAVPRTEQSALRQCWKARALEVSVRGPERGWLGARTSGSLEEES